MFLEVQKALDILSKAIDHAHAAPTAELLQTLTAAKTVRTCAEVLETTLASLVAKRQRHGDGGAGLLNQVSGLSRTDAKRKIRTEAGLTALPAARQGVTAGAISFANADKLLQAARKAGNQAVKDSPELVQLAKTLPEDEFARAAQRWTTRRLNAEDLATQHRRHWQQRYVQFWSGDDGSVQMRGSFDTEMGARIQQRLRRYAEQLRQADRQQKRDTFDAASSDAPRTPDQRMADALDGLTRAASPQATTPRPNNSPTRTSSQCTNAGHSDAGLTSAEFTDTERTNLGGTDLPSTTSRPAYSESSSPGHTDLEQINSGHINARRIESRRTNAEIVVRADVKSLLAEPGGVAEIAGTGPIPPQTLQRLACNCDLSLVIFADGLTPLYETATSRAPTAAQRRALIARDGACIGCGAPPTECEAHHIVPWSRGGKTQIDNLTLVCWSCHDRIHDNNWQVVIFDGEYQLKATNTNRTNPAPSRKPKRLTTPTVLPLKHPPPIATTAPTGLFGPSGDP